MAGPICNHHFLLTVTQQSARSYMTEYNVTISRIKYGLVILETHCATALQLHSVTVQQICTGVDETLADQL